MKLYKPTNATVAMKIWRKEGKVGLLFGDEHRVASGHMWVKLPKVAWEYAQKKLRLGKLIERKTKHTLDEVIVKNHKYSRHVLVFVRIYFDGMNFNTYNATTMAHSAKWYAEFKDMDNGQRVSVDADYYQILDWAGADRWYGYQHGGDSYYVEGIANVDCVGGIMSIHRPY